MSTTTEPEVSQRSSSLPSRVRRRVRSGTGTRHLLLALLGLLVVIAIIETTSDYRNLQFAAFGYLGIAAGGLTVLTGVNGQLSLGHGAFMAIGAYTTALFLGDGSPVVPLVLVLLIATVVTTAAGTLIGLAAARLKGPYIAGATLALAVGVPGIALHFSDTLGGEQGLGVVAPPVPIWVLDVNFFFTGRDLTPSRYLSYIVWICLIVTFVLLANLAGSRVGRRWRAVRDDEVAAEIAGINLGRARVSAFVVSTACAGLAGAVMALVVRLTAPGGYTLTLSLTLLTAVVLGGLGSLWGALVGAALLSYLPQLATNVGGDLGLDQTRAAELAPLVYGAVMIAVILLAPAGIAGAVAGLRQRRQVAAERRTDRTADLTTDRATDLSDPSAQQREMHP